MSVFGAFQRHIFFWPKFRFLFSVKQDHCVPFFYKQMLSSLLDFFKVSCCIVKLSQDWFENYRKGWKDGLISTFGFRVAFLFFGGGGRLQIDWSLSAFRVIWFFSIKSKSKRATVEEASRNSSNRCKSNWAFPQPQKRKTRKSPLGLKWVDKTCKEKESKM